MSAPAAPERLLMAKELVDHFEAQGVTIHYRYARAIIAACPAAVRGRYILFSDAWNWWLLNPGFRPFSAKEGNEAPACEEALAHLLRPRPNP